MEKKRKINIDSPLLVGKMDQNLRAVGLSAWSWKLYCSLWSFENN